MPDFSPSDFIATAALIISAASAFYAKQQSRSAERAARDNHRAYLAEHHRAYDEALQASRRTHKTHLIELSKAASTAATRIIELTDRFDTRSAAGRSERRLRDVLDECSEMIYHAFKGQLAWQTGLNISKRLYGICQIEFELAPEPKNLLGPDFRHFFEQQHLKNPNIHQEALLPRDPYFCSLLNQLRTRIDSSRLSEWASSVQRELAPFRALHESKSDMLKAGAQSIEELMDEGRTQHFPLTESAALYKALQRQRTVLGTMSSLIVPCMPGSDARHPSNHVSICAAICATLFVANTWLSWGWEEDA